jgi:hypothetical protein
MQSVYSFNLAKEKKLEDEIVFFKDSVAKTFDLYLLILGLLKAIKQYVDNQLIAYNKHQIIKDEKYLRLKCLSENRFLNFINDHSILKKHLKNKKIHTLGFGICFYEGLG